MPDFRYDFSRAPDQPDHTCPRIDGIIEELEILRQENSDLRDHGNYWQEKAEEYANELAPLEEERDRLQNEVEELQKQLGKLESQYDDLESRSYAWKLAAET